MPIPKAVQEAAERAERMLQAPQETAPPPAQPEPPAPAPQPAPPPAPAGSQPTPPSGAAADDSWEHRHRVLQGKYNAEVPRLHSELGQLRQELEEQKRLASQMAEQLKAVPPPTLVTRDEIEEHGEGLIDVVRRAAREELAASSAKIAELEAQLSAVRGGVQKATKASFLKTLTDKVPNWTSINEDSAFHSWLSETDPLSGRLRQHLLDDAHAALDGDRAATIFTAFGSTRDSWAASSSAALAEQVVPNTNMSAPAPPVSPQGRVWQRAEVSKFYDDVRARRINAAEAAATEAEIHRAMMENRIQ
jgi:BMFP domain-containing protein YqiC